MRNLDSLKSQTFDLLIIGGGITGAAIAREAALHGYKVALVEKNDFASGTSSKSARMIHGGLRYLENYQFGMVYDASNERYYLTQMAPRLVRPLPFTFPVYKTAKLLQIRAGMWLYELLAKFRNYRFHRILSAQEVQAKEPAIKPDHLVGAASYYDATANDARLTLALILAAQKLGAVASNYVEVFGFLKENGRINGVEVKDTLSGYTFDVKARLVINASGVWADRLAQLDDASLPPRIRANRGVHVIVSKAKLPVNSAVAFTSMDGKRALYAMPWHNTVIIGTTDEDHGSNFDEIYATAPEVRVILEATNYAFPQAKITQADIISTYAGLRPLFQEVGKSAYQSSRDHHIWESAAGLISISGGKLTTHRKMAEDLMAAAAKALPNPSHESPPSSGGRGWGLKSYQVPLIQADIDPDTELAALHDHFLPRDVLEHLINSYGADYKVILDLTIQQHFLSERIVSNLPYILAEVPYFIREEMALTLSDVMERRTHIIHEAADQGMTTAPQVAALMAEYLGWDAVETARQLEQYRQNVALTKRFLKEK